MASTAISSDFYENFWSDESYHLEYSFYTAANEKHPAIQVVWSDLIRPSSVLDFGCGNGVFAYWLKQNDFAQNIKGVDISSTGVDTANKMFAQDGLTYAKLEKGASDIKRGDCDVIVSSHVFEHIPDADQVLSELSGKAEWYVFEVPLEDCVFQSLKWRLSKNDRTENSLGHVNFWNKQSFRDLLDKNGFFLVREYQYAAAPFSRYNNKYVSFFEKILLKMCGVSLYSKIMCTHYCVLLRDKR